MWILLLACLAVLPLHSAPKVQILGPGVYYRKDVPKELGGAWMALVKDGSRWTLQAVKIQMTPLLMEQDKAGRKGGVEIQPKGLEDALLLLKGLAHVAPGPVPSVDTSTTGDSIHNQRTSGTFQEEAFQIWSEGLNEGKDYVLRFQQEGRTQMLFLERNCDDCSWDLLWAGDLDGDDKLDLLMATSGEENQGALRLLLSSLAEEHQKVGSAGYHRWTFGD